MRGLRVRQGKQKRRLEAEERKWRRMIESLERDVKRLQVYLRGWAPWLGVPCVVPCVVPWRFLLAACGLLRVALV